MPPPPPSPTEGLNFVLWPHPKWLKVPGDTSAGNFPVSQVISCRYTLLAWNSSISLAASEKQINSSQQSPKMLNMDSESSIHGLFVVFRSSSRNFRWVPLMHLWALLGLFTDRNWQISRYPFLYFNKWNFYPFIYLTPVKDSPFGRSLPVQAIIETWKYPSCGFSSSEKKRRRLYVP